jgi:hypothetical protein
VRIENKAHEPQSHAYLWLTLAEASELRDALDDLVRNAGPEWHAHVASADFGTEITIAWAGE